MIMKRIILLVIFGLFYFSGISQSSLSVALKDKIVLEQSLILEKQLLAGNLKLGNEIYIRIIKKEPEYRYGILELWVKGNGVDTFSLFKIYPICYYSGGIGPKHFEGDAKTPEGFYFVNKFRLNQYSNYERALNVGYPNKYDKVKSFTGNNIMIHGSCCSLGCIAMTDEYIDEIWTLVIKALAGGQIAINVDIFPFKMTNSILKNYSQNENREFWKNLKDGYDFFEKNKIPPKVKVQNGKYVFE